MLAIAGSDSGGGAGIQADIKTITTLGAYAATAITALTAQNTLGRACASTRCRRSSSRRQIAVVLDDIGADAVKTGMLGDVATIEAVADALARHAPGVPLVVDPVMVAKGGASLLRSGRGRTRLIRLLLPMASVITPNLPEAEVLSGLAIPDIDAMRQAAAALLRPGGAGGAAEGRPPARRRRWWICWRPPTACEAFAAPRIDLAPHARHRLHAGQRGRRRPGAGHDAARRGAARARVCAGGDCERAGVRQRDTGR